MGFYRYVPALGGVLLCHSNVTFLTSTAAIKNECPFLVCNVGFEATVWSPVIGAKLSMYSSDSYILSTV